MSSLTVLFAMAISSGPSPAEIVADLDAHPWRPIPAAPLAVESTSRATTVPMLFPLAKEVCTPGPKVGVPANGSWQIQLGALSNPDAANSEKKRIEKILGYGTLEIFVDANVQKLRYGKFSSKEDAETARIALKAKGLDGFTTLRP